MNPLDDLGGILDEATKARMRELDEQRKRDAMNITIRQKLLAIDQAQEADRTGGKPTEGEANLQRYGTTDPATARARGDQGGVYEDPKTLALRMRTDQDSLRAELEAQASGKTAQGQTGDTHLYEGVGPGGERYFSNSRALAHKGGATDVQPAEGVGEGNFANVGGGTSDAQRFKDRADDALRRLNATPAEQTSDDVMRDFLKNKDYYRGLAEENGAEEAEQQMTADALDGKLPMHAVAPLSRMFGAESRLFLQDSTQGLPPNRPYAEARKQAMAKLEERKAMQEKAHALDLVKEQVDQEPGGTLRPAVDTAKQLATSDQAPEGGVAVTQRQLLETPSAPQGTPNAEATPSPVEDLVARKKKDEAKRKKAKEDADAALQRRARDAGMM